LSQKELSKPTTIYALIDPRDKRVRYVGKTCTPLRVRIQNHMLSATRPWGKKTHCRNWIKSLIAEGIKPDVSTLMVVDGDSWAWWERYFIRWFRSIEPGLTNHCDGGEGAPRKSKCVDVPCSLCGKVHRKRPHEIKDGKNLYCSRSCANKGNASRGLNTGKPSKSAHLKAEAMKMRKAGATYRQMAEALGTSESTAHRLVSGS